MDYNIDDFIAYHNSKYINYCEAIILPDGHITYAEPSHVLKLQLIWGVPMEELYEGGFSRDLLWNSMPQFASPVYWLSEALNCVVLWYNAILFPPNYTEAQIDSVKKLIKERCIASEPLIHVTIEKSLCDPSSQYGEKMYKLVEYQNTVMDKIHSDLSK